MKSILRISLALFLSIYLLSAETAEKPRLLLRGVLDLGKTQLFSLSTDDAVASKWIKVGQTFKDHKVVSFDPDSQILTLEHEDGTIELSLTAAQEGPGNEGDMESRLAEAKHILSLIDFEDMMDKTISAQMDAMAEMMTKQMQAQGGVDEGLIAFQQKAMKEMFDEIDWEPIKEGMSQAYAEVFTQDELTSISAFYATPAGEATLTKQPELQQKTMKIMMPSIMKASMSMQQKMMKYMQERKAAEKAQ